MSTGRQGFIVLRSPSRLVAYLLAGDRRRALQALVRGFTYVSDTFYPYRSFSAKMPQTTKLTPENFRTAVGIGRKYTVTMKPTENFFEYYQDPDAREPPEEAKAYALLEKVMKATLSDVHWVSVNTEDFNDPYYVYTRVYICGRTEDGDLAGLSTRAVQT